MDAYWLQIEGQPPRQLRLSSGNTLEALQRLYGHPINTFRLHDGTYAEFSASTSLATLRELCSQDGQTGETAWQTRLQPGFASPSVCWLKGQSCPSFP